MIATTIRNRLAPFAATALMTAGPAAAFDYVASVDVQGSAAGAETVSGTVFHDLSRDGRLQDDEPGIAGVMVSNGRDVVTTADDGRYELPVYDNMTVMIVKPATHDVPTDENGVPQFFRHHLPDGTPEDLRYGGLKPTGALPASVDFPLVRSEVADTFSCVMMGDTQPYSNTEVGYVRDATLDSILGEDLSNAECMIMLGDVMGDDLGLLPRFMSLFAAVDLPQYYVHGNHDYDFDATTDEHSADSWRQLYGPNYYAFEIGNATFIALDNVVYPCGPEDDGPGGRDACSDPEQTVYNGRVTDRQMEWLAGILDNTPEDRLIVLVHHIPFVSFIDSNTGRHQTDNLAQIHDMLAERPAVSFSGHTHTFEYLDAGEWYQGWEEQVGVTRLPFPHVVGGAPSGNWFFGDLGFDGTPLSFARGGTPPGYMIVEFDGSDFTVDFRAAGMPADRQMALAFNTPGFRDWFTTLMDWTEARDDDEVTGVSKTPPVTVNDLPDTRMFTPEDIEGTVWLTANVWNGGRATNVFAQIGDGPRMPMERTQAGDGEDVLSGADYADPFSVPRQMTVGRYAWESTEGDRRAQGFELWQGTKFGPATPQSAQSWMVADQSPHLWRLRMPADLPMGTHVVRVTAVQPDGREWTDHITFEMRADRPLPYWDDTLWGEAAN